MSEAIADNVTTNIDKMLTWSSAPPKPSIFRVGEYLRNINPDAYDPEIIAIGPFHRNNDRLQKMEQHKLWYLKLLLQRRNESSVERYVTEIRSLENRARECYAEEIQLDQDEFLKMLLLDGCFIVEFLWKFQQKKWTYDDPVFQYGHIQKHLMHDLMLFENQIPFFVIDRLFNMIKMDSRHNVINSIIWPLLHNSIFPVKIAPPRVPESPHLLGIVYDIQCSSFAGMLSPITTKVMGNINSATELKESGISFRKSEDNKLFHIEFKNRTMRIPVWEISDATESSFRNLIAYEYYQTGSPRRYVTDYIYFMHCLVHSPEDAKLLRRHGIISNLFGGDEMVYQIIKQLGKNILISDNFSYSGIVNEVHHHYIQRRNRWMAMLRRDYFNSPWALVSVIAAITLLVLTTTQTTFAILSYRNDLKKD